MNKAVLIFTLFALIQTSSCYFNDNEVYEAVPVADDPSVLTVESNLDTLFHPPVGDSLKVFYSASVENGEFFFMEAELSDEVFYSSDSIQGSFWLYPSQSTGLDSLFMVFYHSSNTNTLADKAGYEARITSQRYAIDFNEEELK